MKNSFALLLLCLFALQAYGQRERSYNRKGLKDYEAANYGDAEVNFLKALENDSSSVEAAYNMAGTLYKLEKYTEANEVLSSITEKTQDKNRTADVLHNIGNNLLRQEMYQPSVEAYKNSLKLRPEDDETRYNLAYAQAKLKQQQEQQQNQDQNKDQPKDQDKNKQQEQDQKNQEQEQQEQEQNQQQQDQKKQEKEQQQPQQQQKQLSKEDMERLLQAIQQQEKDVKDKVEKQKAAAAKVKSEKDW